MNIHSTFTSIISAITAFFMVSVPHNDATEPPIPGPQEFRVIIDPGHGGINVDPVGKFGDKYDVISGKFLDVFKEGAAFRKVEENIIMFQIAEKVRKILALTETDEGFDEFRKIVEKHSSAEVSRIVIHTKLSRVNSRPREELEKLPDPNVEYRLFDFPSSDGKIMPGRISAMNAFKPHMIVSLHCAESTSRDRIGMNAVICPPYSLMASGFSYLKGERRDRGFFMKSRYADWFEESSRPKRSLFQWFLNDVSVYFTSYHLDKKNKVESDKFLGYRYNMVTWKYGDESGWEKDAADHGRGQYSSSLSEFVPEGPFWDRERAKYEDYRRANGPEGYGGDNYYASMEIIRYALLSVNRAGYHHRDLRVAPPYISIWSVPLHVNAISAYIELGYIRMPSYRHVLTEMQDQVAEGIAVGIYSVLAGTKAKSLSGTPKPKGKKIDLDKYRLNDKETYFDSVVK
ncbi:MAG TPA: hypothetical protein PKK43_01715 [Spirochaetota bacterium]|nr:hypothetical protein [Spirochaetota bacterium]